MLQRAMVRLKQIELESHWDFLKDALRTAHTTASDAVASAVLSGELDSKPE
jgi:hypothetical protein